MGFSFSSGVREHPDIDSAVALTFLSDAVRDLERAGVPQTKLMSKLRHDANVWPTWAELRTAALLLKTPPRDGAVFYLEPNRNAGCHADFQFILPDGEGVLNIEFKAIGLSDEESAFCGRMAPYLDVLLPPSGRFDLHSRLKQQSIPIDQEQLLDLHRQATEYART